MWYQLWIPILIPTLIIKSNCDDNKTESDVVVHYDGHADAEFQYSTTTTKITTKEQPKTTKEEPKTTTVDSTTKLTTVLSEDESKDVVFVPNKEPPVTRSEPEYYDRGLRVKDVMMMKSIDDAMNKDFHVEKEDDTQDDDIVFISGKNHDVEEEIPEENTRRQNNDQKNFQMEKMKEDIFQVPELNCNDLDCNNNINSTCGAKFVDRQWRHRLFMNECYFRKVNCAFKYEINRYKEVPISQCKRIGSHNSERPFVFKPKPVIYKPDLKAESNARRTSSSRRSLTTNINGEFCSHSCPVTCPDNYEPECAISSDGKRRVFLNHCKLDYNSCYYSVVWHKRPLAECVGGKKADMRQNRGFIGWMQRVGIVDRKGRLVLE